MMIWRLILPFLILPLAALADDGLPAVVRDEAWFTGSLASTGANALPEGHFLAEPYLGGSGRTVQSLNLLLYGITDELTAGLIPRFSWRDRAEAGDVTARAQYRFLAEGEASLAAVVNEDMPASGRGAYATHLGLLADDYTEVAGRPLRLRLNLSYDFSRSAENVVAALEYSVSTRWAAALDITYDRVGSTQSAGLVPAIEYNFTAYTGLIIGAQLPVWQRAAPRVIVPLAALNCVF